MTDVIYCAGGNRKFAQIAIDHGFKYGAQLPDTIYFPPYFADQNWKKPNRERYMKGLAEHHPYMATVLDWEREDQFSEVMDWAEEASQHVSVVVIVPKVQCGLECLPHVVNGAEVRLGYSVPSKYGATELMISDFSGWPVHLLGGNPWRQMELAEYMDVLSVDGNAHHGAAVRWCTVWTPKKWEKLMNLEKVYTTHDAPYKAFGMSCKNIMAAWKDFDQRHAENAQEVV